MLGICRVLLRDAAEAEDAAQATFLSAYRALLKGIGPREPAPWLAAIARNECRARIRTRMRRPLPAELPADLPDPVAAAIASTDLDALWGALGELPWRQRHALVLRELSGLSYGELAVALGVSEPAVESLLFRARQQLRTRLGTALGIFTVPLGLRDTLARVVPGFDAQSAGTLAKVASLPVAAKLASAAVGTALVAGGAVALERDRTPRIHIVQAPVAQQAAVHVYRAERRSPARRVAFEAAVVQAPVRHAAIRPAVRHRQRHEGGPEVARTEPAETEQHPAEADQRPAEANQHATESDHSDAAPQQQLQRQESDREGSDSQARSDGESGGSGD